MHYRFATTEDASALAVLNHALIRDEGHRNPMTVAELQTRMAGWLSDGYEAVVFEEGGRSAGYALYRRDPEHVNLRQFFVRPESRRRGSAAGPLRGSGGTPGAKAGCGWKCWSATPRGWRSGGRSGSRTTPSPWRWRATPVRTRFVRRRGA
jgi:hypothetical protein